MLELWISIISITDWWIAMIEEWISIKGLSFLPFHGTVGLRTFLRFGCLNVLGPISPNDFHSMMTSSNGNIFRVTGPLCGEFTCHRWIPLTKASDMELWCFLRSATEQTFKQTIKTPVIWDAIPLIMTSLECTFPAWLKFHFVVFHFLVIRTNFAHALTAYMGLVSYLSCAKIVAT